MRLSTSGVLVVVVWESGKCGVDLVSPFYNTIVAFHYAIDEGKVRWIL